MDRRREKVAALTSCTLDHALRLGEDRTTRAERVDVPPDLIARLVRVDARHATRRIRERLGQALNRTEIHLQPRRDDERVVREGAARVRADCVVRRVEGRDVFGYVRDVRGDKLCERSSERRLPFKASTDESPVRSSGKESFKWGWVTSLEIGRTIRAARTDQRCIVGERRKRSDGMEAQETHLIVVVFCSVYNGDVSGLKRLPCVLETVVQLMGDTKSARAYFK